MERVASSSAFCSVAGKLPVHGRFGLPSVLRSSRGKGGKTAKRKMQEALESDKENVAVAAPVQPPLKSSLLTAGGAAQPAGDRSHAALKVYSKYH